MKQTFFLTLLSLCILGCKSKQASSFETNAASIDTTRFFSVPEYILNQVNAVNKTPYYLYQKENYNGHSDSFAIDIQQFNQLAQNFLQPDISAPSLKQEYTESVFFDQTTKTYTLNYSTKNKNLEIQNIDVLLLEDAQTLKRIFIRKYFNYNNDSTAIEQLSWNPDQQFQIARMVQKPQEEESIRRTTIVWNLKD